MGHEVEPPERGDGLVHGVLAGVGRRGVEGQGDRGAAGGAHGLDDRVEAGLARAGGVGQRPVGIHDPFRADYPHPASGEPARRRAADPRRAGRADHQGDGGVGRCRSGHVILLTASPTSPRADLRRWGAESRERRSSSGK
jgi:hypothetical protein